jgi:hypothetical protein
MQLSKNNEICSADLATHRGRDGHSLRQAGARKRESRTDGPLSACRLARRLLSADRDERATPSRSRRDGAGTLKAPACRATLWPLSDRACRSLW